MTESKNFNINHNGPTSDSSFPSKFTIKTPRDTDIWNSPQLGYHFTAPITAIALPTQSFHKARVTFSVSWSVLSDQGGLIFVLPSPSNPEPNGRNARAKESFPRWVKAGIEINEGKPNLSVVARDRWSDWSLVPVGEAKATVEMVRNHEDLQVAVWKGEERTAIRDVPCIFKEAETEDVAWVGVYAARPDPGNESKGELEVHFEGLEVWDREGKRVV